MRSSFGDVVRAEEALRADVTNNLLDQAALSTRVRRLAEDAASAGATTVDDDDREVLQGVIDYWNTVLRAFNIEPHPVSLLPLDEGGASEEGLLTITAVQDLVDLANMTMGRLRHQKIVGVNLEKFKWKKRDVIFQDCRFINCSLRAGNLDRFTFIHTRFEEVPGLELDKKPIHAQGAIFKDCVFDAVDLRKAHFEQAHLDSSVFKACKMDGTTSFNDAYLVKAILEGVQAHGRGRVSFDSAFICESRFTRCDLRNGSFREADLTGCIFEQSSFQDASFYKADFSKANFRLGPKLARNSFERADLTYATMRDATGLENCDWSGADFDELQPSALRGDLEMSARTDEALRATNATVVASESKSHTRGDAG
jgi:uncharacterized protein YjbI with pentapeptide repeats